MYSMLGLTDVEMSEIALKLPENSVDIRTVYPREGKSNCPPPEPLKKAIKLETVQMLATQSPDRSKITP